MDRRERKRAARRDLLLDLAADLVEQHGVEGMTMAALAEAADYAPASLYTYFPSRSALLAALQERALHALAEIAEGELATWDAKLAGMQPVVDEQVAALARLCAFADLFLSAPQRQPREFRLQQELLVHTGVQDARDAATVLPAALVVLDVPRRLLQAAADLAALDDSAELVASDDHTTHRSGRDVAYERTVAWVLALNGVLLAEGLTVGLPGTGEALGEALSMALLRGWGADPAQLSVARRLAETFEGAETPVAES